MNEAVLHDLTDKIYDSLFEAGSRQLVVDQMTDHLGYESGAWFDPHISNPDETFMAFKGPDDVLSPYLNYYASIDPWHVIGAEYNRGDLMILDRDFNQSELPDDECYNDYILNTLNSSGICCIPLDKKNGLSGHIALYQSRHGKAFDHDTQNFMKALSPHFVQFDKLYDRVAGLEKRAAFFDDTLDRIAGAVMVIDGSATVIACNRNAEKIMKRNDGFTCINSKLSCKRSGENEAFRHLVNDSINPGVFMKVQPVGACVFPVVQYLVIIM